MTTSPHDVVTLIIKKTYIYKIFALLQKGYGLSSRMITIRGNSLLTPAPSCERDFQITVAWLQPCSASQQSLPLSRYSPSQTWMCATMTLSEKRRELCLLKHRKINRPAKKKTAKTLFPPSVGNFLWMCMAFRRRWIKVQTQGLITQLLTCVLLHSQKHWLTHGSYLMCIY